MMNNSPFSCTTDTVSGRVDYEKLRVQFGAETFGPDLVERLERLTGKPLPALIRRGFVCSHRSFGEILDAYEQKRPFYLYTGRGASSEAMHLGHLLPFYMTQALQEPFDVPVVIQLTDDEEFIHRGFTQEEAKRLALENARDIIACGFNPAKTFIFCNTDYIHRLYPTVLKIQNLVTENQVRAIFGFQGTDSIAKHAFPAVQAAPAFAACFPHLFPGQTNLQSVQCLIPCGIDQDPYFRMARDVAPRLGYPKPALLHFKFIPSLAGIDAGKMSASLPSSAIYLTDSPALIASKIRGSFSGGRQTRQEQQELGANLDVDVAYQYLRIFSPDDQRLQEIGGEYKSGRMMTSEIKRILITMLEALVRNHQDLRAAATPEVVRQFMAS